jgi:hypothetical protein
MQVTKTSIEMYKVLKPFTLARFEPTPRKSESIQNDRTPGARLLSLVAFIREKTG